MSKPLDIDTFHKYLLFLAGEVKAAVHGGAEEDAVARMNVELQTLLDRCSDDALPPELASDFRTLFHNYQGEVATIPIRAALMDGLVMLITRFSFNYARKQRQLAVLQGLKTDLEALAMHVKMRY